MLPPGRARPAANPLATGSFRRTAKTIGTVPVARWAARHHHDVEVELNELGDQAGEPVCVPLRPAIVDHDRLALDPAQIAQAPLESRDVGGLVLRVQVPEKTDSRDSLCRRLGFGAHRRGQNREDENRDQPPQEPPVASMHGQDYQRRRSFKQTPGPPRRGRSARSARLASRRDAI
jgi:hypothetical protein